MNVKRKIKKIIIYSFVIFFLSSLFVVLLFKFVNPPITTFMVYQYFNGGEITITKEWVDIENIKPYLPLAAIASEDQRFLDHFGLDFQAIKKAIKDNDKEDKVRGGSTITQQLAKNLFLIPSKNYVRKGLEAYFTILLETFWSKRRIMEVYLNVVEFGKGVYGASAAAKEYFGKDANQLTKENAALMITVLPNPKRYRLARPSGYMYKRSLWIQRQMYNVGGLPLIESWYE